MVELRTIDPGLRSYILEHHSELTESSHISHVDLAQWRLEHLEEIIAQANEKNDHIRHSYDKVDQENRAQTLDIQEQLDSKITFGQRIADVVAKFGGSWTFILSFLAFMLIWMLYNLVVPTGWAFDKYPFILLNLALSTLAAVQAPLIMMSQNRASDYDRLQAKNDFLVNRRSEEEIQSLHKKMDHVVQSDQSDLLRVQELQMEMLVSLSHQVSQLQEELTQAKQSK